MGMFLRYTCAHAIRGRFHQVDHGSGYLASPNRQQTALTATPFPSDIRIGTSLDALL
jgi:hypothetical protein